MKTNKQQVPFLNLRLAYKELEEVINYAVLNSMDSGTYIGGSAVEIFECNFASYVGSKYCVGVGNGLDAIHLALRALGLGTGDEILVPAHTFIATWLAVIHAGATPVPVDIDERYYTIDINSIEKAITSRTKAIIPVHLYGQPCNLTKIKEIADAHHLHIIEDAAQAHGAIFQGRKIGAHGNIVAWSFYPGKNLGALGDAGAVTTDNYELATKLRMLRNYGSREKYKHELPGFNSRLDPIQATILAAKLPFLDEWNLRRQRIAETYTINLNRHSFGVPILMEGCTSSWHLFVIRTKERDLLKRCLSDRGIDTLIHYPELPQHQCGFLAEKYTTQKIAKKIVGEILSLPISPHHTDAQINHVITSLNEIAASPPFCNSNADSS
jgi:dTDP-4-amino-4,6-dideoxygalactose transaminase